MTSRKRSRPEDDSSTAPYRSIFWPAQEEQKEPERVLADRQLFLTVPRGSIGIQNLSSFALAVALDTYNRTERYVAISPDLNGLQRASLTAVLSILSNFFSRDYATLRFATSLDDAIRAGDGALASFADKIDQGLVAFVRHGCDCRQINAPDSAPSGPSTGSSSSSATATTREPKCGRFSKICGRSQRQKINAACITREGRKCFICQVTQCVSAHIIPFTGQGSQTLNFWNFVGIFRGVAAAAQLKAAALAPDPESLDTLMNTICLCHNCQVLFHEASLTFIPMVFKDPSIRYPFDPHAVEHYNVRIVFAGNFSTTVVGIVQHNGELVRMRPGHVFTFNTTDPTTRPLPHPLLIELHLVCSRMVTLRTAAGYPVLPHNDCDGDSDGDTPCDPHAVVARC